MAHPPTATGAFSYTAIHEASHYLGLAHPHDDGGDSEVMEGVTSEFGSYGVALLNQGVFTTMSYNDGWSTSFGQTPSFDWGAQSTPMALDIAGKPIWTVKTFTPWDCARCAA